MILVIAGKELRALFGSPLAWVVLAVVQFILGWLFLAQVDVFLSNAPQFVQMANPPGVAEVVVAPSFGSAAVILLMATPILGMRSIADEWRGGTMPLLMSAPVSMTEIVLGKFLGLTLFLWTVVLLTLAMCATLALGTSLDWGLVAACTLGLALLTAAFAALALFASSLTRQPLVAAVITLGGFLALWIMNGLATDPERLAYHLSLLRRFESMCRGIVGAADLAFFALAIALALALTIRRLDGARLGGVN